MFFFPENCLAESQDMDISPGDSTPTSEASYSHSSTPTAQIIGTDGPVLLANALPRLASHPIVPTSSQLHFNTPTSSVAGFSTTIASTMSSATNVGTGNNGTSLSTMPQSMSKLVAKVSVVDMPSNVATGGGGGAVGSPSTGNLVQQPNSMLIGNVQQLTEPVDLLINSNAPGPPNSGLTSNAPTTTTITSMANLPKILSQITGNKTIDQSDINPQKALQTINNALMRQQSIADGNATALNSNANCLR